MKCHTTRLNSKRLVRKANANESVSRDEKINLVLSNNPSALYKAVRSSKNCNAGKIQRLFVQDRLYLGEEVADGFYESLLNLKTLNKSSLESPDYVDFAAEFENIIEICKNGEKILPITEDKSREILMKIKPAVMDLYSMTANHYINAG